MNLSPCAELLTAKAGTAALQRQAELLPKQPFTQKETIRN
jgi:hypothetical protein